MYNLLLAQLYNANHLWKSWEGESRVVFQEDWP